MHGRLNTPNFHHFLYIFVFSYTIPLLTTTDSYVAVAKPAVHRELTDTLIPQRPGGAGTRCGARTCRRRRRHCGREPIVGGLRGTCTQQDTRPHWRSVGLQSGGRPRTQQRLRRSSGSHWRLRGTGRGAGEGTWHGKRCDTQDGG